MTSELNRNVHVVSLVLGVLCRPIFISMDKNYASGYSCRDSYWVLEGLLTSGMTETAKGMLINLIGFVKRYATLRVCRQLHGLGLAEILRYFLVVKLAVIVYFVTCVCNVRENKGWLNG